MIFYRASENPINFNNHTLILCHGLRTPFAALGKRLTDAPAKETMLNVFRDIMEQSRIDPEKIDSVLVG
jgi:hypothetical protein